MIIQLYRFTIGAELYLYTTAQHEVTYNGETYVPTYIRKEGGTGTERSARAGVKIRTARDAGIATRFAPGPPSTVTEIEVYEQNDGNTKLVYLGRVLNVGSRGSEAVLQCESIQTSMRTAGLRRRHQVLCPYALYDEDCTVDPADFRVQTTLASATATTLTSSDFSTKPDGWFTGGFIEWGSLPDTRGIIGHSGDTITLSGPLDGPAAGDDVNAYAGCDHTFDTCKSKFSNGINHGGNPIAPDRSPFDGDPVF